METRRDQTIAECAYVIVFVFESLRDFMEVDMNTEWTQRLDESLEWQSLSDIMLLKL